MTMRMCMSVCGGKVSNEVVMFTSGESRLVYDGSHVASTLIPFPPVSMTAMPRQRPQSMQLWNLVGLPQRY